MPAVGRLRQEDNSKSKASLGYSEILSENKNKPEPLIFFQPPKQDVFVCLFVLTASPGVKKVNFHSIVGYFLPSVKNI